MKKQQKKLNARLKKTNNAVQLFLKQTIKNYKSMIKKIKVIWACLLLALISTTMQACNVTRTISTESKYYQKGDSTCTIVTKIIETYNAQKK